ncbi:MAG TPA: hypothetical protein VLC93_11290, partial [Myxococcota bacterium]|nr:hypothetical protein [Myxococcota bacterium]
MQRFLAVIAVVSLGCATTVPLDELAQVAGPDARIDTGGLIAGGRIGLLPSRTCPVEVYAPGESISTRAGSAADDVFPRKELTRLTVNALLVDGDRATALVADVTDSRGRPHRLAIKTGEQVGCLVPWTEALERLHEVVGTVVAFRPEGGACNAIALRGDNVRKLFDAQAVDRGFEVTAITVRGDRAVPWVKVGNMEVRHDVLA